jgi:hypothetical protein
MTSAADFLADAGKVIERDGFGRYLLPHPDTGKRTAFTRVTTFARSLRDTYALTRWQLRKCGRGLSQRGDLIARIASEYDDDLIVDKACDDAMEHAGSTAAATYGTAMHRFTEQHDRDEDVRIPELLRGDLDAYARTIEDAGLIVRMVEQVVFVPDYTIAGTLDRVVLTPGGRALILDVKTGDVSYAWVEIAVQLACYARASHTWNIDRGCWEPMPPVDQRWAVVAHLPVGEHRCDLWSVDIAAGWELAALCAQVRDARNRRDVAIPYQDAEAELAESLAASRGASDAATAGPVAGEAPQGEEGADRAGWLRERLAALASDERARRLVASHWPEGVTTRPPWSTEMMDALAGMLDHVEAQVGAQFPAPEPTPNIPAPPAPAPTPGPLTELPVPEDDMALVGEDDIAVLLAAMRELTDDQRARLQTLGRDAMRADRQFARLEGMTRRAWLVCRAAVGLARWPDDASVRMALVRVWPQHNPAWQVGAVIGSLTTERAEALADLADQGPESLEPF